MLTQIDGLLTRREASWLSISTQQTARARLSMMTEVCFNPAGREGNSPSLSVIRVATLHIMGAWRFSDDT